jgi:hypothetical protein
VLGVAFSVATLINPYYTAALAPAVAAIIGIGVATAWSSRHRIVPVVTGVVVVASVVYAVWLLPRGDSTPPEWLRPAVIAVGVGCLVVVAVAMLRQHRTIRVASLAAGLVAICLTPTVGVASIVASQRGVFDTPFEPAFAVTAIDTNFIRNPANVAKTVPTLEQIRDGAPYLLATQTAAVATLFIDATGEEALPIGGFDGAGPSPTLAQIQADVCRGQFRLALVTDGPDPRLHWIAQHCEDLSLLPGGLDLYRCAPPAGC